jgi:hypothetical protein
MKTQEEKAALAEQWRMHNALKSQPALPPEELIDEGEYNYRWMLDRRSRTITVKANIPLEYHFWMWTFQSESDLETAWREITDFMFTPEHLFRHIKLTAPVSEAKG